MSFPPGTPEDLMAAGVFGERVRDAAAHVIDAARAVVRAELDAGRDAATAMTRGLSMVEAWLMALGEPGYEPAEVYARRIEAVLDRLLDKVGAERAAPWLREPHALLFGNSPLRALVVHRIIAVEALVDALPATTDADPEAADTDSERTVDAPEPVDDPLAPDVETGGGERDRPLLDGHMLRSRAADLDRRLQDLARDHEALWQDLDKAVEGDEWLDPDGTTRRRLVVLATVIPQLVPLLGGKDAPVRSVYVVEHAAARPVEGVFLSEAHAERWIADTGRSRGTLALTRHALEHPDLTPELRQRRDA